jgi:hypothetical protein
MTAVNDSDAERALAEFACDQRFRRQQSAPLIFKVPAILRLTGIF